MHIVVHYYLISIVEGQFVLIRVLEFSEDRCRT